MNETIQFLLERKSVRSYEDKPISQEDKDVILKSAMRAPTAGNMTLYSIIDITDQNLKNRLAETCDNQPFIAKAPMVLMFFADYQRWYDYYNNCKVAEEIRKPNVGDMMLACSDALIAAQNAVIAAEALGLGSCYIGDIMSNYKTHKQLLNLPDYVFPLAMVVFGYPTQKEKEREQLPRYDKKYIVFENQYKQLNEQELNEMYATRYERFQRLNNGKLTRSFAEIMYNGKYVAEFSINLNKSVGEALKSWQNDI